MLKTTASTGPDLMGMVVRVDDTEWGLNRMIMMSGARPRVTRQ